MTSYAFSVSSPQRLKKVAENGTLFDTQISSDNLHGDQVAFLREASNTTFRYASIINDAYDTSNDYDAYQDNSFDLQMSWFPALLKGVWELKSTWLLWEDLTPTLTNRYVMKY